MYDTATYNSVTRSISVSVEPIYLEDQSDPEENRFVWAYRVRIENHGQETVRLISRYWNITDSNGIVKEVRGRGVVGEQPILEPGDSFEYASGTPLPTGSGIMVGHYRMMNQRGEEFDIEVPAFPLDIPDANRRFH